MTEESKSTNPPQDDKQSSQNPFEALANEQSTPPPVEKKEVKETKPEEKEKKEDKKINTSGETEKSVLELPEETVLETAIKPEEELLIEQGEDFFWILQRVIWGVVKTAIILGIIGFLIWLIWRPEKKEISKDMEKLIPAVTEEGTTEKMGNKFPIKIPELPPLSDVIEELEDIPPVPDSKEKGEGEVPTETPTEPISAVQKTTVEESSLWLQESYLFFQEKINEMNLGATAEERAKNVDIILLKLRTLLEESNLLQRRLSVEIKNLYLQTEMQKQIASSNDKAFRKFLFRSDQEKAEVYLSQKIEAEKKMVESAAQVSARRILLKKIEDFDPLIRQMYANVGANRRALIENIPPESSSGKKFLIPSEIKN
ncbi:hypothetical protein K9M41_00650 [Candidatus Gracilibacteria bacterium]|nr:hypothetical protein [Candidatus Gracilibacteria bacterium]